jgi:hypothetical protein
LYPEDKEAVQEALRLDWGNGNYYCWCDAIAKQGRRYQQFVLHLKSKMMG